MLRKLLLFISILSVSFSYYLPMKRKSIDFGADICRFDDTIHNTHYNYVMGCEKGKYCASFGEEYNIHKCVPYTPLIKMLGDDCENDYDCDSGLECTSKKCSIKNSQPYLKNNIYFCPPGFIRHTRDSENTNTNKCIQASNNNKCYIRTESNSNVKINEYEPDYFKICGKTVYEKDNTNKQYIKQSTDMNFIGEVDDGNMVENEEACKSGYALKFYGNGELTKPFTETEARYTNGNNMFKFCVTVKEVEYINSSTCRIKYTKGSETTYIYEPTRNSLSCDEFLMTKLELFQKYVARMNEIKDKCQSERHYDAPFLCDDNELKKLQYFYDNPKNYLLYQNEQQIVDYLVQDTYKSYEAQDLSNSLLFLNLNYFILILLFFISF